MTKYNGRHGGILASRGTSLVYTCSVLEKWLLRAGRLGGATDYAGFGQHRPQGLPPSPSLPSLRRGGIALVTITASLLLITGCATPMPPHPQTAAGWAYEIKPTSNRIGVRDGNAQSMLSLSTGFFWLDSVERCESHRAAKVAQIAKAKPYMVGDPERNRIELSECRQATVTVNEGRMWGYMKPDGSLAAGWVESQPCESGLARDVMAGIMPIAQRNCIAVSIAWK